jgi:hypothetical protein
MGMSLRCLFQAKHERITLLIHSFHGIQLKFIVNVDRVWLWKDIFHEILRTQMTSVFVISSLTMKIWIIGKDILLMSVNFTGIVNDYHWFSEFFTSTE